MLLDELDAKVLRLLREDARLSFRDVAQKTGSTVPTVSARVKVLEDLGIIRGYHADLDLSIIGGPLVLVTLQTRPSEARNVALQLGQIEGAEGITLLAGGHIQARMRLHAPERTLETMHDKIAEITGVLTYDAREALAFHDAQSVDDLPTNVDVKCHLCQGPIHSAPVRKMFGDRMRVFCCRQCLSDFADRIAKLGAKVPKTRARRA